MAAAFCSSSRHDGDPTPGAGAGAAGSRSSRRLRPRSAGGQLDADVVVVGVRGDAAPGGDRRASGRSGRLAAGVRSSGSSDRRRFRLLGQHRPVGRLGCASARSGCRRRVIVPSSSSATRSARATVDGRCTTSSAVVRRQHPAQRLLDQRLGVHVECRERVVEHQDRWSCRRRREPARGAAAARRTATSPAPRSGCPVPRAGRGRTRPGRCRAPARCRRRWRRGSRG